MDDCAQDGCGMTKQQELPEFFNGTQDRNAKARRDDHIPRDLCFEEGLKA